jgi:hypothetical protein
VKARPERKRDNVDFASLDGLSSGFVFARPGPTALGRAARRVGAVELRCQCPYARCARIRASGRPMLR